VFEPVVLPLLLDLDGVIGPCHRQMLSQGHVPPDELTTGFGLWGA
jgi:hypothetical protein